MRELAKWGLVGLAVLAVVAGLVALGGPGAARIAKRDADRLDDLNDLRSFVECVAVATDGTVPDSLVGHAICNWDIPLVDQHTDQAYGYEKLTDTAYQLCAGFEDADRMADRYNLPLDVETGCITWTYRR